MEKGNLRFPQGKERSEQRASPSTSDPTLKPLPATDASVSTSGEQPDDQIVPEGATNSGPAGKYIGVAGGIVNSSNVAGEVHLEKGAHMDMTVHNVTVHNTVMSLSEKIEIRTTSRIQVWTQGMVVTTGLTKLMEKLDSGTSWITVKGQPGEGKTTAAYMALKTLQESGRQVFQVLSPKEFTEVATTFPHSVILLDDLFGQVVFDPAAWSRWKTVIVDNLGENDHTSHRETSKEKVTVIFVGRSYVLDNIFHEIGKIAVYFTDDKHIVYMSKSGERKHNEKVAILKAICHDSKGIELDKETIDKICTAHGPHGFPHTCRLFVTLRLQGVEIDTVKFMESPLQFLNQTVQAFLKDTTKVLLFKEMIRRDGNIKVSELQLLDNNNNHAVKDLADSLLDSYLRKVGDCFTFHHPSIFDCISFNLLKYDPLFVIKHCSVSFLRERVRLQPPDKQQTISESNLVDQSSDTQHATPNSESNLVVNIPREHLRILAKRFAKEILQRNLVHVLSHPAVTDEEFVAKMMSCIWLPRIRLPFFTDRNTDDSFLNLITSNKSPQILKYLENQRLGKLSNRRLKSVLYGVCQYGAIDVLTYVEQSRDTLDINVRYEHDLTPLKIACEFGQMDVMRFLVGKGASVNTAHRNGWSPLHSVCGGNNPQAVQWLLDQGAECNSGTRRANTPLHTAAYSGSKGCVVVLVNAGAGVNVQDTQGDTPLHTAAASGSKDCVVALVNAGARVNVQNTDGYTPLHTAAASGSKDCVVALVNAGAGVNVQTTRGHTPLDVAKLYQHQQCVDVLQKAGAVTNRHFN